MSKFTLIRDPKIEIWESVYKKKEGVPFKLTDYYMWVEYLILQ